MIRAMKNIVILTTLCAALAWTPALRAADGSISVSPSVVMLRGEPGQSTTQTLTFTNGASQPLAFEMTAMDAVVRDGKRIFVEAGTVTGSIAASAAFSPKLFTVAPGQSVGIDVTVTIPAQPSVRAIAVMCQGTTKLGTGAVRMTGSVGTLLTFALSRDVIAAEASPLAVQSPTATLSFAAAQQLTNSGTAPIVVAGMLAIIDATGALAGRQAIPGSRLLPGEKTGVRVEYDGDLAAGRYKALITWDLTDKTLISSAEFDVR